MSGPKKKAILCRSRLSFCLGYTFAMPKWTSTMSLKEACSILKRKKARITTTVDSNGVFTVYRWGFGETMQHISGQVVPVTHRCKSKSLSEAMITLAEFVDPETWKAKCKSHSS